MEKKTLTIIAASGIGADLVHAIQSGLPKLLNKHISEDYRWNIEFIDDSYILGTNHSKKLIEALQDKSKHSGSDYIIALTDLPVFIDDIPVVAEVLAKSGVGFLSLPGFGFTFMKVRLQEAIIQLMMELYYGTSEASIIHHKIPKNDGQFFDALRLKDSQVHKSTRIFEMLAPLIRLTRKDGIEHVDVRYTVKSRVKGMARILSGMVFSNSPWKMFRVFLKVLVIALTTGAYALSFSTLWEVGTNYTIARAILMMSFSIFALTTWIIIGNRLWENENDQQVPYLRRLYNLATIFTLLIMVVLYYILLTIGFVIFTSMFLPPEQLETYTKEPVSIWTYVFTSWIGASLATIIGVVGSTLEDRQTILESTYSYRQKVRNNQYDAEDEDND